MMSTFDRRARFGFAVVAFSLAVLGVNIWSSRQGNSQGEATAFPGMTEQTATATNVGVVIETRRAVFSGTSVDVEVAARAADGSLQVAGVSARGAELAGANVTSAHIRNDG